MIMFQIWLSKIIFKITIIKTKLNQKEINKKNKNLMRSVFQDLTS